MTQAGILQKLTRIFRDVLDEPALELRPDMTAQDVEGWDSVNHIHIIVAVEVEFGIKFQTSEIQSLKNVGDLIGLIARKSGG